MAWAGPSKKSVAKRGQIELANHIKRYRLLREMTQFQLAYKIGISETTMYQIERRLLMPKLNVAIRIANYFDLPVQEMFFDPSQEPPIRYSNQNPPTIIEKPIV